MEDLETRIAQIMEDLETRIVEWKIKNNNSLLNDLETRTV